jgi:putative oxidoreductase
MSKPNTREQYSFIALRILLCVLIAAHGWSRFVTGAVEPFGIWLNGQGFPFGLVIASAITILEIAATPLLALGKFIRPLCLLYAVVYSIGLVLVHVPHGWFVVGLGRNGMEYSVLLITCFLCVAYQHRPDSSN